MEGDRAQRYMEPGVIVENLAAVDEQSVAGNRRGRRGEGLSWRWSRRRSSSESSGQCWGGS